ncbi:MAG: hypothetical protein JXI43_05760 [Tissierellales bacterium]|nr:hypothetical protein [Tissierellales bacterium]
MNKEEIFRIVKNPNLIPGIHNYCDLWCERCEFTYRCANFSFEEKHLADPEEHDIQNKQFWNKLSKIFQVTLEMLEEFAEQQGIDLESIDYQAIHKREEYLEKEAYKYECSVMSKEYIFIAKNWFDSSQQIFDEKVEELQMIDEIGIPNSNFEKEIENLTNITDVIRWYQNQIHIKIMRAVTGLLEEKFEAEDDFPKDSDGSAKVALIGIDRSISAWGKLLSYFPSQEDELLKILVLLERLRRKTEKEFPNARAFIRPGFDEV